jgi:hypothetical protein
MTKCSLCENSVSSFGLCKDLTKEEEQKECFNYKNPQPLWADENLSKGCKIMCQS